MLLPLTIQSESLTTLPRLASQNNVGKEKNADKLHFLLFPQYFSKLTKKNSII